jgi:hypothetical protein
MPPSTDKRAIHFFGLGGNMSAELLYVTLADSSADIGNLPEEMRDSLLAAVPGKDRIPIPTLKLPTVFKFFNKPAGSDGWMLTGSNSWIFYLTVAQWNKIMSEVWTYQQNMQTSHEKIVTSNARKRGGVRVGRVRDSERVIRKDIQKGID